MFFFIYSFFFLGRMVQRNRGDQSAINNLFVSFLHFMGVGVLGVFSRYSNKFFFQKYYMENRSPMPQVVTWSMFMKYRALQDRIPPRSLSEESEVVIFHHPSPLRGVMHPCDVASPVWACEPELFASPVWLSYRRYATLSHTSQQRPPRVSP